MLRFYDSYSKRIRVFRPLRRGKVAMYNCGPTVYDYVHLGNLRSFLFADILRRYLEYRGYKVRQIMNITDVGHMTTDADAGEDKMALAARREGKGPQQIARFFEEKFFEDLQALSVRPAFKYPRASKHIPEMVRLIKRLLERGYAYKIYEHGGGYSIYFDLTKFPRYGKLSGNTVRDLIPGARAEVVHEKRNPYDFALWIYKPNHVLQWATPWGKGYPGWHLECSAMAKKYLGETLDIHTGGEDNKFPHHECEIAQSESATGKPFTRVWLHVKHLLVEGKKMSKSLQNFYTLRDLLQKGYTSRQVRFTLISAHYRETLNFTLKSLEDAKGALQRLDDLAERLRSVNDRKKFILQTQKEHGFNSLLNKTRRDFIQALDNDLNVPQALAAIFKLVRVLNHKLSSSKVQISRTDCRAARKLLQEFDTVLGLGIARRHPRTSKIPETVLRLAEEREQARQTKDWIRADALRKSVETLGYRLEDHPTGPRLKTII